MNRVRVPCGPAKLSAAGSESVQREALLASSSKWCIFRLIQYILEEPVGLNSCRVLQIVEYKFREASLDVAFDRFVQV